MSSNCTLLHTSEPGIQPKRAPKSQLGSNDDEAMAVEPQSMPILNGMPNGDIEMDDSVKNGALRFTSGMILPPPEIKCELLVFRLFLVGKWLTFMNSGSRH
jgi:hypothetical protein